ncbi:MAG: hypothetical protein ACI8QS_001745 [Planctomycetota bacterium]|jgi:hypothetical protein
MTAPRPSYSLASRPLDAWAEGVHKLRQCHAANPALARGVNGLSVCRMSLPTFPAVGDAVSMKNPLLTLALGASLGLMSCAAVGGGHDVLDSSSVYVVEASGGA